MLEYTGVYGAWPSVLMVMCGYELFDRTPGDSMCTIMACAWSSRATPSPRKYTVLLKYGA